MATPAAAARTFYKAAAAHDLRTARLATAPSQRTPWATDLNPDIGNLRATGRGSGALTNIHVDSVSDELAPSEVPPDVYSPKFDKWVDVGVSFNALYRDQTAARDDKQIRFVLIGRNAATKDWLFFTSGTGP